MVKGKYNPKLYDPEMVGQMYTSGLPIADILEISGLTEPRLRKVLNQMGVPQNRVPLLSPEQVQQVIELHKQGLNYRKIAQLVGCSDMTVAKTIRCKCPGIGP